MVRQLLRAVRPCAQTSRSGRDHLQDQAETEPLEQADQWAQTGSDPWMGRV